MADFPNIVPSSSVWSFVANTQRFASPLTQQQQVAELTGTRWEAELTFNNKSQVDGDILFAFFASLRGSFGTFNLPRHDKLTPRGIGTGTPLVNGASQTGNTLATKGWTISTTGIMSIGDLFQVGTELKILTADANSDVSGNATLTFESPLRASPADNDPLTVNSAKAVMRLKDDNQTKIATRPPIIHNLRFSCIEVI